MLLLLFAIASAKFSIDNTHAQNVLTCRICEKLANALIRGDKPDMTLCNVSPKVNVQWTNACEEIVKNKDAFTTGLEDGFEVTDICEEFGFCEQMELHCMGMELAVDEDLIAEHNSKEDRSWTAGINERFVNATVADVVETLGTVMTTHLKSPLPTKTYDFAPNVTDFDWRTEKGSVCPTLTEVRDQANCGSCWAFGSVEAMSDRICIKSNGKSQAHLSAQDMTSCDHLGDMGCNGGIPMTAYLYYETLGVVTGGNYGDKSMCWSYQKAPCAHHTNSTKYPACPEDNKTPKCARKCEDDGKGWEASKIRGGSSYNLKSVDDMMSDIVQNGPITAQFMVHQDFLSYKSGVYEHRGIDAPLGGHAIKIIGFGTQAGKDYWLVANSWNEDWGDHGFFKIVRGKNNCQIENFAVNGGPVAGNPPKTL